MGFDWDELVGLVIGSSGRVVGGHDSNHDRELTKQWWKFSSCPDGARKLFRESTPTNI